MSVKIYFEVVASFHSKDKNQKIYFAFPFQSFNLRKLLQSKGKTFFLDLYETFMLKREKNVLKISLCLSNLFRQLKQTEILFLVLEK